MENKDLLHIENILSYCDDISNAIDELNINYNSFITSKTQKGVLAFFVEQIGEEAGRLSPVFRSEPLP